MKNLFTALFALCFFVCGTYAQTRRALLVGISDYDKQKTDWPPIHGTNDVVLMGKALVGFKVTKLTNASATYANITKALNALVKQSKTGDIVYLHFSGHGQPYEDQNGDEEDGWDEAFVPYDAQKQYKKGVYEGKSHLTDDKLHTFVEHLRRKLGSTGIVYVSIDACHSGDSYKGGDLEYEEGIDIDDDFIDSIAIDSADNKVYERGSSAGFSRSGKTYRVNRSSAKTYRQISSSKGLSEVVMLESCRSVEKSKEIKCTMKGTRKHFYCGPLSYSIYWALTQKGVNITDAAWVRSVRSRFSQVLQPDNSQQLVIEATDKLLHSLNH